MADGEPLVSSSCWINKAGGSRILVRSGNSDWGGLIAPSSKTYYLGLKMGGGITQTLTNVQVGATYRLTFYVANRPNYPNSSIAAYVDVDGDGNYGDYVVSETPGNSMFTQYGATWVAQSSAPVLKFESPTDDQ
jgi:hypothetical protein